MSKPICKIADIIFVRFELIDLAPQKEYMEHFGMFLAYETADTIFYRGTGTAPYCYVATKGNTNRHIGTAYRANAFSDLKHSQRPKVLKLLKILILVAVIK